MSNPQGPDGEPSRRKGLLGDILQRAKNTSTEATAKAASLVARKCLTCGAGRPEDTDIRVCAYCGARFMTDEVDSPADPGGPDHDPHSG